MAEGQRLRQSKARRTVIVASFLVGQVLVVLALLGPLLQTQWWLGFRRYFSNDQLSYAAIATNFSQGNVSLAEPFTLTGNMYYPSLWYQVIGLFSGLTGASVELVWQILGISIVGACVAVTGWVGFRLSGRSWAPIVPGAALFTGTLSTLTDHYWYTSLSSHAVLWGPYGTLFTLNAETAALSMVVTALSLMLLAILHSCAGPGRRVLLVVSAVLIGLTANVQTYSFFTGLSICAIWFATMAIMADKSRKLLAVTVGLITALLLAGQKIAGLTGPLPMFGLLLVCLAPAVFTQWKRHKRGASLAFLLVILASSPQIVRTLIGLHGGDPFLTYRQASTKDLGVPLGTALLAALPVALIGLTCALALRSRRAKPDGLGPLRALLITLLIGGFLLMTNDYWGFNQEPYRFLIQYLIVSLFILGIMIPVSVTAWAHMVRGQRLVVAVAALAAVTAWSMAFADFRGFWTFARDAGIWPTQDDRSVALRALTEGHTGLFAAAPCVDQQLLKLVTGKRVAYYNRGLAWPADPTAIDILTDPIPYTSPDARALRKAGVEYIVGDSACPDQWVFRPEEQIALIRQEPSGGSASQEHLLLYRVLPL